MGRAPSNFEAPRGASATLPHSSATVPPGEPEHEAETDNVPEAVETRRLVVRLLGGEQLELGRLDNRDEAVAAARD